MENWFKWLFSWIRSMAETKWSIVILVISAFADASLLPLPVTGYFMILILLNIKFRWKYVIFVALGTLAGSLSGYYLGHFTWIKPNGDFREIVYFLNNHIPGFSLANYEKIHSLFARWNFWILCAATVTPLPYGIFSLSSGIFNMNILVFTIITLLSQTLKYSFLAFFANRFGSKFRLIMNPAWQKIAILAATFILVIIIISKSV